MTHTILIIDDNPDDTEITKRALAHIDRDLKVEAALGGEAAMEFLRSRKALPSLILLDLKMDGMDGQDTLRKIRYYDRTKHVPVVIVTSSSLEADEIESYKAGADGFLHKSFEREKFLRDMKAVLKRWINN